MIRKCLMLMILLLVTLTAQAQADLSVPVRAYLTENPENVGVACYALDDPEAGVFHQADEAFQLASTYKIILLTAYALQVEAGLLDPAERVPLADVEAYYLPGTDGNAHPAWMANDRLDIAEDGTLALAEIPYGMIRHSSNAAADYLLARLADFDFAALYAQLGLTNTREPQPLLGIMLILSNHETGQVRLGELDAATVATEGARLTDLFLNDANWRAAELAFRQDLNASLPTVITQFTFFARYGNDGSPQDFARLMAAIYQSEGLPAAATAIMREYLEWPLQNAQLAEQFTALGTKGGSFAGILTAAYYAEPVAGEAIVLAVFYRNLDLMTFVDWSQTYRHQVFEFEVLEQGCSVLAEVFN